MGKKVREKEKNKGEQKKYGEILQYVECVCFLKVW